VALILICAGTVHKCAVLFENSASLLTRKYSGVLKSMPADHHVISSETKHGKAKRDDMCRKEFMWVFL